MGAPVGPAGLGMGGAGKPAAPGRLALKRSYERAASIEPFFTGGAIALSRDGAVLACACGGEVKLLDTATGAVLATVEADGDQVTALALAPSGQELMTAGRDFMVRTWGVPAGGKVRAWKASQGNCYVQRLAYDETSTLAAGGCSDGVVRVWDAGRGFATHSLRGHGSLITSVCFGATPRTDPNKLLLFSAADDGEVRVWSLAAKACKSVLKSHDSAVTAMCLHAPTRSLVTGGRDRVVNVWDLKTMKLASSVPVYDTIEGLVVVPSLKEDPGSAKKEGKSAKKKKKGAEAQAEDAEPAAPMTVADIEFVTAGEKGQLKRWRVGGGKCLLSETEHAVGGSYEGLLLDEASGNLLAVTIEQTLLFVDPHTLKTNKQMVGHNDEIVDTAFASEELVAVCTNTDHLRIFNIATRSCRLLHGHTDIILCVDCSAPGGMMMTSSKDRTIRVWETETGRCVGLAEGHVEAVGAVAIAPRNRSFAVSGSKDLTIKVWDLQKVSAAMRNADSTEPAVLPVLRTWKAHDKDINSVAVSPNDSLVATGSADRTVKFWDASTGQAMGVCKGHKRGVWCVKFSPVDKVVASSSADSTLKLWSLADHSCLKTFEGHEGSVLKCAFVCSGMQLLSSGSDGLLKLWTIKSCECVGSFDHHEDKVWALAVAPGDDTLVVTGGADGVINLWDDKTLELDEEAFQKSQEKILLEQDMKNALRAKDYRKAAMLAFELKKPYQLLQVINEIMAQEESHVLDEVVKTFSDEQLGMCIGFVRDWNTTSRNSHPAQVMLNAILRTFRMDKLAALPDIKAAVDALVPYTERHFQRLEDAIQKTYYIDYVLHATNDIAEEGEGAEEEEEEEEEAAQGGKVVHQGIDLTGVNLDGVDLTGLDLTNGGRMIVDMGPVSDDDEEDEEMGGDDDGAGAEGMAGWGDWGGDEEGGGEDGEGEEEEEEDEGAHKSASKKGKDGGKRQRGGQAVDAGEENDDGAPRASAGKVKGTPTPKKAAAKVLSSKKSDKKRSMVAVSATPPPSRPTAAKTTGKKPKRAKGDEEPPVKRRKSLDPAAVKRTPPLKKRLRSGDEP